MDLNLRALMTGHVSRLRYVPRFSICRVQHRESVAEHSYYVILYAWAICRWLRHNQEPDENGVLNMKDMFKAENEVLERAILHDVEECRTGDCPRPFKHSTPALKKMMDDAASIAFSQVVEEWTTSDSFQQVCQGIWQNAKQGVVGRVVEFSDFLSCLSYFMQERRDGNATIEEQADNMMGYCEMFTAPEYAFLQPLVQQAKGLLEEVCALLTRS